MKKKMTTGHAAARRSAVWPVRCSSILLPCMLLLCLLLAGCSRPGSSDSSPAPKGEESGKMTSAEAADSAEQTEEEEHNNLSDAAESAQTSSTSAPADATDVSAAPADVPAASADVTAAPADVSAASAAPAQPIPAPLTPEQERENRIRQYLGTLPLEDKVSGLFILTPEQLTGYDVVTEADDLVEESLEKYPVAGLIFFGQNIVDREQVEEMLTSIKEWGSISPAENAADSATAANTESEAANAATAAAESVVSEKKTGPDSDFPLFLAIDEEGGNVMRIGSSAIEVPYVGSMAEVGATGDPEAAYRAGSTIGGYLRELGFNLDFAPDADVLVELSNETIGDRSFGSDPELCGSMVHRYVDGLHENGIASCIKHFPGLGDTESDTHTAAAWSSRTLEEYRNTEFVAFGGGIDAGTEMVMVSHLSNAELSGSDLPASLNKTIISDLLREELGYQGLVITDSLRMGAVAERFDSAEAAVTALEAGADLLLMPADFQSARQGLLDAVHDGRISEERIEESLSRILQARAGLAQSQE